MGDFAVFAATHLKNAENLTELVKSLILMFRGYTFTIMQTNRITSLESAVANREAIAHIKSLYLRGRITRDVAKALAEPVINRINKQQAEICKKYGKRHIPTTFIGLMR